MAVLCRNHDDVARCAAALGRRGCRIRCGAGQATSPRGDDTIKVMTMHVSKGLEFPVVALAGVGAMPAPGQDEADAARLFYVAATRATQAMFIPLSGSGAIASRLCA